MKKVGVFIDGLNVRKRLLECRWEEFFDVQFLAEQLTGPRKLVSALYYHPAPNAEHLGRERYSFERAYLERVAKGESVTVPSGAYMAKRTRECYGKPAPTLCNGKQVVYWIEKQTDVLLASDLVYMAAVDAIDVAIVASADADIVPAIRRCRELGVPVELLRFRAALPRLYELEQVATSLRRARPANFQPYNPN